MWKTLASLGLLLAPDDRLLILAPHPDDEVLGCGGVIAEAASRGLPVEIVFLTNGDDNEASFMRYKRHPVLEAAAARAMGEVRRREALEADGTLGVSSASLVFLGYPDRGMTPIWSAHWGTEPPYRSRLTRADHVAYADARRPGAPYKAEEVLADLAAIIKEFRPTKVFVSHPGDHHPDHRALALFAEAALWEAGSPAQAIGNSCVAPKVAGQGCGRNLCGRWVDHGAAGCICDRWPQSTNPKCKPGAGDGYATELSTDPKPKKK